MSLLKRRRAQRTRAEELEYRRLLGVPDGYPERLSGGDDEAGHPDFRAWADEMAADGMSAGEIILAVRAEEDE